MWSVTLLGLLWHFFCLFQDEEDNVYTQDFSTPTLEDHFDKTILPKVMQVCTVGPGKGSIQKILLLFLLSGIPLLRQFQLAQACVNWNCLSKGIPLSNHKV